MKIISKFIIFTFLIIFIFITYLSLIGIETKKFNNQINNKIKNFDKNLELDLKKIKLVLSPFDLSFKVKTLGPKLLNNNKTLDIESIRAQISLGSLMNNNFAIKNLEISTKSLEINNLISFIRLSHQTPELYILKQVIKKGYIIADIKIEFDSEGKIKDNYVINGFIKDSRLSLLKKYSIDKLDFIFKLKNKNLIVEDLNFSSNSINFNSDNLSITKINKEFSIKGEINNKITNLNSKKFQLISNTFFSDAIFKNIKFSSGSDFSFKLNKKLKIKDLKINSKIKLNELKISNFLELKKILPNIKDDIVLTDNDLEIEYSNENLFVNGYGDILLQNNKDNLSYSFKKKNDELKFKTNLKIKKNPLIIDILNYKRNSNNETKITLNGSKAKDQTITINSFSLEEANNKIYSKNLIIDKNFQLIDLELIDLNYIDVKNKKNLIQIFKKDKDYFLKGKLFNADNLIENLINSDEKKSFFIKKNFKINIDIDEIRLDKESSLTKFSGNLVYKEQKVFSANLIGSFSQNKKLKFTVRNEGNNRITTLYADKAKPIVGRYKFIKGFDEGELDFYSINNGAESTSTIKIYDFKLKELPMLTKILTLASLQGIADILSGEGIRFNEFEMKFRNKKNLMTIEEIYAIGPAISILMEGYVEKNRLISLRGTLVPATTINKFIGSLPVLGKILVGSKTGEGVFGVSFKIKGPPKDLETTVNPIKTLTPRFITRTLEKIKKN